MESQAVRQAELRIWGTIQPVTGLCEAIRLVNPWNRLAGSIDLPVGLQGQGLLSWIPENRMKKVRSISSGLVQGDHTQLLLSYSASLAPTAIDITLLARSAWSRAGIPLSEAMVWPGGVVLGKGESEEVLPFEVDYYGLWLGDAGEQGRMLLFSAADYRRFNVEVLGERLHDAEFQKDYLTYAALDGSCPRHSKSVSAKPPERRFLILPKSSAPTPNLPREATRLFRVHWVLEVINLNDPIPLLTKEAPWALSRT